MKIIIPGGSGQVGNILARYFTDLHHEVVVLSRNTTNVPWKNVAWDAEKLGDWVKEFEGADAVINLAGRSVNCRYNPTNRKQIIDSRVNSTRIVGEAIRQAARPPKVWLQASSATIYSHRFDAPNNEATGLIGGNPPGVSSSWQFSLDVINAWEKEVEAVSLPQTRKVILRTSLVMSPDKGGVFDTMAGLVCKGLGGKMGDGKQFVSWIHDVDFSRAIDWLIHHELSGPVIIAAPNPLPNAEFMKEFRKALGVSIGLPAMKWMLELGAIFMRTETELILKSRRVVPGRLLESGFAFQFPTWPEAVVDLCRRWRK